VGDCLVPGRSSTRACTRDWASRRPMVMGSVSAGTPTARPRRCSGPSVRPGATATSASLPATSPRRCSGPHPRLDRHGRPADQLPPVPPRALAVGAQRPDPGPPPGQARPVAGGGPVAVPGDRGVGRLRGHVLPGTDLRPRPRPALGGGAHGRHCRGRRPYARDHRPAPDDHRGHRRRGGVGVPLLQRGAVTLAVLQHQDAHPGAAVPGQPGLPRGLGRHPRVVSQPLGDLAGAWNEVPESSYGVVHHGQDELHPFRPRLP
jgi:hypothetical protein